MPREFRLIYSVEEHHYSTATKIRGHHKVGGIR